MDWVRNNEWLAPRRQQSLEWSDLRRFTAAYRPYWRQVTSCAILAFAASLPFLGLRHTFDRIQEALVVDRVGELTTWTLVYAGIMLGDPCARWAIRRIRARVATAFDKALLTDYFRAVLNMRVDEFLTFQHRVNIYQRVVDAMQVTGTFTDILIDGLHAVIVSVVVAWVVGSISMPVLGVMVIGSLLQLLVMMAAAERLQRCRQASLSANYPLIARMVDMINNLLAIKSLASSTSVAGGVTRLAERRRVAQRNEVSLDADMQCATQFVKIATHIVAAATILSLYRNGHLTAAESFATYVLVGHVFGPVTDLARLYYKLTVTSVNIRRYYEVMDFGREASEEESRTPPVECGESESADVLGWQGHRAEEPDGAAVLAAVGEAAAGDGIVAGRAALVNARRRLRTAPRSGPAIAVDDVHFRYREDLPRVLQGVSLRLDPGERVSIIGRSGAGKTTLFRLLLGFISPQHGAIRVHGQDVRHVGSPERYRRQFGVVHQHDVLFEISLRENLLFGLEAGRRSDDDIRAVLESVDMRRDVESLPEGLDTVHRPDVLSMGQRQRLCIARVLLRDPDIVLLDEPTASLDFENEERVLSAIERLMAGRTTVTIAHRVSTIMRSPRTLVLNGGRIIADGPHDELYRGSDYYRALCRHGVVAM